MNTEVTEANFITLANNMVGSGLLSTGKANYELAKDLAQQEAIAFKKFWDNYTPPEGKFPNDEELYNLYKEQSKK